MSICHVIDIASAHIEKDLSYLLKDRQQGHLVVFHIENSTVYHFLAEKSVITAVTLRNQRHLC